MQGRLSVPTGGYSLVSTTLVTNGSAVHVPVSSHSPVIGIRLGLSDGRKDSPKR